MKLLKKFNASGVWIDNLAGDDILGWQCRCGSYPLMRTISEELRGEGECEVSGCLV